MTTKVDDNTIKLEKNKNEIIKLLKSTNRKSIDLLIQYLESANFFRLPKSLGVDEKHLGGLAEHSLAVYNDLKKMNIELNLNLKEDSMIIAALLHDVCICDEIEEDKGKFVYNNNARHGYRSAKLIKHLLQGEITDEELYSIYWHIEPSNRNEEAINNLKDECKQYTMIYYLQIADMKN